MYSESKDGQVILTMSREDYNRLFVALGFLRADPFARQPTEELMNRLNQGNPHFTPYQVEAKKS